MTLKPTTLETMLCDDLEAPFLKESARRMRTVYREAEGRSYGDAEVHEKLQPYCFWQNRYILAQSMFIKLGEQMGYDARIHTCETNGFPIPIVKIGRFFFTIHHSSQADEERVRSSSLIRQQCSGVNFSLIQPGLFEPKIDESELLRAEKIYGNIIFGTRPGTTDFVTFGFVQVAVPFVKTITNKKGEETQQLQYVARININNLLDMMAQRETAKRAAQPRLKAAEPKLKTGTEDK